MIKALFKYLLFTVMIFVSVSSVEAGYTVENGRIYDDSNNAIRLRGVNWFGFELNDHVVHGLWTREWKSMITQMKSLGFNAVRLPFCPATLQSQPVSTVNYSLNPDLQNKNSLEVFDLVINKFNNEGMYVLLDHHRPDCAAISELWYTGNYSEAQWISDLTFVANRYKNLPYFLGVDLKNEPHGAATWGTGNNATDWNKAAERARHSDFCRRNTGKSDVQRRKFRTFLGRKSRTARLCAAFDSGKSACFESARLWSRCL